jgi:histidyl-tRNA synthetase
MFSGKDIPSVGFSFGIERIFVVMEQVYKDAGWLRGPSTEVLVTSIGKGLALERFKLIADLWKNGIKAEFLYDENPKPQKSMGFALENKVPFMLWIGSNEIEEGTVTLKVTFSLTNLEHLQED